MKKFLLFVVFSLFLLPFAVMGQCGTDVLKASDADGNTYTTLKVGPHCWTQFNLKTKAEGSFIYKSDMYPDTTANLGIYGRLYNWYAAMNIQPGETPVVNDHGFVQGVCPEGWHLPNDVEVAQLMTNTTPALHDVHYWLVPGTNTTTYTMRPGGFYNAGRDYGENLCGNSFMWTAQSLDENNPLVVWSDCHCDHFIVDKAIATDGMSVRCVYKIYQGTVTTDSATNITDKSATLYGTVAFSGYDEEYERGFVYGTDPDNLDQWAVKSSTASDETAPFNTEITGLTVATKYYYQAYIINDFDTAWGEIKDFTTLQMQVSTDSANTITHYAATLHGNLIYLDYASVNAGFKYGTSEDALTSISEVSTLSNLGQYSATLEGLAEGTTYFFKAFAANGTDTVYGNVKSFTTKDIAVAANAATNVQSAAATLNGELTILKGYEDAKGGFRYGQHKNYMVFFAEKEDAMKATGSYSVDLSNISPNTTYYFQAYAYNGIDTAWAADTLTFTTLTVPCLGAVRANERATELGIDSVLDNEGNSYITVQIGNQCWMAENLRATKYQNSEVIDSDIPSTATSTTTPYMYYPKGQETLVGSLGYLYNYPAVADNRNICPEGWHVPTDGEWFALEKQVLDLTSADSTRENVGGTKVGKMTAGIDWTITTVETAPGNMLYTYRNNSGFSAYPSHFFKNGSFQSDVEGYFWSSTEKDNDNAWGRGITSTDQGIYRWPQYNKSFGFSVRCLRDEEEPPFTCGTSKVKDVDDNEYNTVKIGKQCWMKENLRTTTKRNGVGNIYTENPKAGYNAETYGYYYDWEAVMQNESGDKVQGICPTGWHVPSDAEWTQLTDYVKSKAEYKCGEDADNIANALSAATGWNTPVGCGAGDNSTTLNKTGFSAVPAGDCFGGNFYDFGTGAYFWSATRSDDNVASRRLFGYSSIVYSSYGNKALGYSVRCLKDAEVPAAMSVTTDSANTVTKNSATLHGNVTSMGKYTEVNAGFKYGTSESTLTSIASVGSAMFATGRFSYTITGLTANTQYYYKAFAANGTDTVYGEVKNFTTLTDVVTDTIAFVPNGGQGAMDTMFVTRGDTVLNANTYTHGGNWHFDGWNTAADGSGTQYADKDAITTNGNLTLYAQWHTWCTGIPKTSVNEFGTLHIDSVKDIDNNKYNVVQIGNQCWMAQNLRTTKYADGTAIVKGGSAMSRVMPYRYFPRNDTNNVNTYGHLYNWMAVMNGAESSSANPSGVQGICPDGWHVPSNAEWNTLTQYVYNSDDPDYKCSSCESSGWIEATECIAKALASTTGWKTNTNSCAVGNDLSDNNATGFSAVPAGGINASGNNAFFGQVTFFWSATYEEATPNKVHARNLYFNIGNVNSSDADDLLGLSVRCLRDPLTVTTDSANTVTNNGATLYGNVKSLGKYATVKAGFRYGTSDSTMTTKVDKTVNTYGSYLIDINNLSPNTTYYFQAYAYNETDTVWGEVVDFKTALVNHCPDLYTVTDHEGNIYNTVQIGSQCWMAQNMRCTTSPNGLLQKGETGSSSSSSPLYYDYPDATLSLRERGLLYNWYGAMDTTANISYTYRRGICPEGWHVPSDAEWTQLTTYVKSVSEYVCEGCSGTDDEWYTNCIAKALSQPTGWSNTGTGCNAGNTGDKANLTGFSAVPAGDCFYGSFYGFGDVACFWSATLYDDGFAWYRSLFSDDSGVTRIYDNKGYGFSVRCLKD